MADPNKEERLMTVYADVHYYFSAPTPRPPSHRFDKGSYLYLYRSRNTSGGRLEIANNVGKREQDAFTGALDSIHVRQSHKHPTLCTITVDGYENPSATGSEAPQHPEHHWRLPNTDPRNEGKYLFRLHTLDIYFWTVKDATSFIDSIEELIEPDQLEILDRPSAPAPHENLMSPVVQKLENVAIEDPAYQSSKTHSPQPAVPSFAPPPTVNRDNSEATPKAEETTSFQPLAYNPAAPPAPEPIKHREKTPPPPEAETEGTGLATAAYNDHQHSVSPLSHPAHGSFSQPPYPSSAHSSAFTSPQPHGSPYNAPPRFSGLTGMSPVPDGRAGSVSSIPPPPPPGARSSSVSSSQMPSRSASTQHQMPSSATSSQPTFSAPPRDPNAFSHPGSGQPLASPTSQILGNSYVGSPTQPLQHLQPQYADYLATRPQQPSQGHGQEPVGGYSSYDYSQTQGHHHQHNHQHQHHHDPSQYDVHNQVYRPTEEESHKHKHHRPSDGGQHTSKPEHQAGRLDKGVNRFFKKLEKRIG
ncbi:MAG: hypothetical protein Q9174_001611 [Haloplaca sp. 1 TL-2023]